MKVLNVKAGEQIAKRQTKVMEWYLIQEGAVVQKFGFAEINLGKNSMIGILENEWFICDYYAKEDTVLIVIPCKNGQDLQAMLLNHANFRVTFLRAAVEQRHKTLCLYAQLSKKTDILHKACGEIYERYQNICNELLMEEQSFPRIENLESIQMQHKAEGWEISNSNSLMRTYLKEYISLMIKDNGMCVGAIMEASAQMRRVTQGIGEMVNYLIQNGNILLSDSENDLFHLFFDLAVLASSQNRDISKIKENLMLITNIIKQLGIHDQKNIAECVRICTDYDFKKSKTGRINVAKEDCVKHIMEYAGYEKVEINEFKDMLYKFKSLGDMQSTDNDAYRLRKQITAKFYEIYEKAFINSMHSTEKLSPIMVMFFNFGFMDVEMLGTDYTNAVYNLTENLGLFKSEHVFTIYEWLYSIYRGEREPSKNEFDQDYVGYLMEQRKNGDLTPEQVEEEKHNNIEKVKFEIRNLFRTGSRMTYGKVTTFCPILNECDFINTVEKIALTAERLMDSLNRIREVDYSIFYREVIFQDPEHEVMQERIMKEVLPDMILMPVVGIRGAMWQETANARNDSSARVLFPIFLVTDLDEQMTENMGRYRWEICRKIQGVYWNDLRDKSLTSEYYDYVQFYRKNSSLSADAKEKVKIALKRARNNYREVFVKDYQAWMKFEAKGSFRLNRVARDILVRYCPFSSEIRMSLKTNPLYENAFSKLEISNQKMVQKINLFYDKYEAAGGEITPELKANLEYYEM